MNIFSEAARLTRYAGRMLTKPTDVWIDGVRLAVPDGAAGRVLASIYAEKYEGLETRALPRYLKPDDVVVEAGAAIGYVGARCARIVGAENVHMIEANKDLVPEIERNFSLNGLPAPKLLHGLAAAGPGPAQAFQVAEQFWSSSVLDRGTTKRVAQVPLVDVPRLVAETSASVFICDIEGGEFTLFPALDFAGPALASLRLIVAELHGKLAEDGAVERLLQQLKAAGFALSETLGGEVFILTRTGEPTSSH